MGGYSRYPDSVRNLVITNYIDGKRFVEIAKTFEMPVSTVKNIVKIYLKEGRADQKKRGGIKPIKTNEEIVNFIRDLVDKKCDITLKQITENVHSKFNIQISKSTVNRCLSSIHYTVKKIKVLPKSGISQHNEEARKIFSSLFQDLLLEKPEQNIFFIDEVGFNICLRSKYGRSPVGVPPLKIAPGIRSRNISICAAMNKNGDLFYIKQDFPFNSQRFKIFIESFLVWINEKELSNCLLIMDNVPFHKNSEIRSIIESKNHELILLPPYSPQFNPIENLFSKWKNYVRKGDPQNADELYSLIESGLHTITRQDCENFFKNTLKEMRKY